MNLKIMYINPVIIAILAVIATLSGLFWENLYNNDTVSITAQMMGQDLITLLLCVPILLVSLFLIFRDSVRGQLLWMGTIFYFLYTYMSMSFAASYNHLFLVYVALFSLSLYTFVYGLITLDVETVKNSFRPGMTTKIAGVFTIFMASMLAFMWLSMIIQSILTGIAPASLESYTTMVIQALDLGVLVPAALISSVLILKDRPRGYALMSIMIVKMSLLGTAILSMIYFMFQSGVSISREQVLFFTLATVGGIIIALAFYSKTCKKVAESDHLLMNANLS
ncbi:MAG: hypothetical protein HVN35_00820 [Methanobacteriaceae archaeon]|nr:hypothetical protein [Methanobacteriaceae archaeon]